MPGIQEFPGPVDSLLEGVLAGSKLRLAQSEIQNQNLRNQAILKELSYQGQREQDQHDIAQSTVDYHRAAADAATHKEEFDAQYNAMKLFLDGLKDRAAKKNAEDKLQIDQGQLKVQQDAEARLKAMDEQRQSHSALDSALKQLQEKGSLSPGLSLMDKIPGMESFQLGTNEAAAIASQFLTANGAKFKPGDAMHQHMTQQVMSHAQMVDQELQQSRETHNVLTDYTKAQTEAANRRNLVGAKEPPLTEAQKVDKGFLTMKGNQLSQEITHLDQLINAANTMGELLSEDEVKKLQGTLEDKRKALEDIHNAMLDVVGGKSSATSQPSEESNLRQNITDDERQFLDALKNLGGS